MRMPGRQSLRRNAPVAVVVFASSLSAVAGVLAIAIGTRTANDRPACTAGKLLPDARCTPGKRMSSSVQQVCVPGYAKSVRNVTSATRNDVLRQYDFKAKGEFEVDHLIPLSIGGSNDEDNLWPQPAPGFHLKDRLEFALWKAVCDGRVNLQDAQRQMAKDWTAVKLPALPGVSPAPRR